uniref:uncharacterized protein LOC129521207 n=1 Tax=Nyctereutes procyonoides TaxID=34880 RepID=UPI002443C721|nr:uncharacterized protein LOC129521207 [Nyctereutes procyonoides]
MRRGLGESQQGPWTRVLLPGARADKHALTARPLFVPGSTFSAWRSRSPRSTPPPGRSVKAKSCTLRVRLAEGRGGCPEPGRVRGSGRVPGPRTESAVLSPGPSSAPGPAEPVGRVLVVCVRVCVCVGACVCLRARERVRARLKDLESR